MIGDFFSCGGVFDSAHYWLYSSSCSSIPSPGGPGSLVGSTKIAENTSPLPQDRFFFNYSFFDSTRLYPGNVDVHRFTPGFEKTFWCGNASFEMRFPMAATINSSINMEGIPDTSNYEFGNIAFTPKVLLCRSCCGAVSMGMTVTVPTADDVVVVMDNGMPVARVQNEATHLMPFVGFLYTPNPCWFAQGFLQYDVAANGNTALVDADGSGLQHVGELNDTAFQYLDIGIGRWLYRSCQSMCCERLRSVALTSEIHWNKSLQDGDYIEDTDPFYAYRIGNVATNVDIWDLTVGLHVRLCDTTVSAAYIIPLNDGRDKPFDGEFRLIVNRWFGCSSENYGYGAYPGIFP